MTATKPLTPLQLQCVALLSKGLSEHEIAKVLGMSRSWVQSVKRHPEYLKIKTSASSAVTEVVVQQAKEATLQDLEEIRNRFKIASDLIFESGYTYLEKVRDRIKSLEQEDLSPQRIGQSLKQASETLAIALELSKSAAGLDEVLGQINEILKPE